MDNPITGYKVIYTTAKIKPYAHKLFNTRTEVKRFIIANSSILLDYVVYEMQDTRATRLVTRQFKILEVSKAIAVLYKKV